MNGPKFLRVGVMTNFGFSEPEIEEVRRWAAKGWSPLLNCNALTEIKATGFPVIATANPNVVAFVQPRGDTEDVTALRLKFVATDDAAVHEVYHRCVQWAEAHGTSILMTIMRFRSKATGELCRWKPECYERIGRWYRLKPEHRARLDQWIATTPLRVCDETGEGCPACRNCSLATYGRTDGEIYGIDLSASGSCPYHCPDCWAKALLPRCGGHPAWDKPKKNTKQKGGAHGPVVRLAEAIGREAGGDFSLWGFDRFGCFGHGDGEDVCGA